MQLCEHEEKAFVYKNWEEVKKNYSRSTFVYHLIGKKFLVYPTSQNFGDILHRQHPTIQSCGAYYQQELSFYPGLSQQ